MEGSTVAVYTDDSFLFAKILLSAPKNASVVRDGDSTADLTLIDIDTIGKSFADAKKSKLTTVLTMSRVPETADITIPFSLDTVAALLRQGENKRPILWLDREAKTAHLHCEAIKLTEVECNLLSLLIQRSGEYVTREEILREVWDSNTDSGVINVYVHYLREKLESRGEKIIISSRKCGYKIDGKYLLEVSRNA